MDLDGIEGAEGEVTRSADPGGRRLATLAPTRGSRPALGSENAGEPLNRIGLCQFGMRSVSGSV